MPEDSRITINFEEHQPALHTIHMLSARYERSPEAIAQALLICAVYPIVDGPPDEPGGLSSFDSFMGGLPNG